MCIRDRHIASIVNKAHARAALIRRCFRSKDFILLFRAFTVLVRPMLEYYSSVWNHHYYCHVAKIESVQRRFTKYIGSRYFMTYSGGDWKRETWHREIIEIVEADIARLDNSAPYRKGGHHETCFIVRVEAQYKLIFAAGSIIWAAHRLHVCSFT